MVTVVEHREDTVVFEAVVRSASKKSAFVVDNEPMPDLSQLKPAPGSANAVAAQLQRLGFRILHVGTYSVSGEGPRELWEETFGTSLAPQEQTLYTTWSDEQQARTVRYLRHVPGSTFKSPDCLHHLMDRAYPQGPPTFLASPLPPRLATQHLRVPDDVATVLRANKLQHEGLTGRGVLVALVDSGFAPHPFFDWHNYRLHPSLAPDASQVSQDELGHGTAVAAAVFSCARDVDLAGIKIGRNPTLAFKAAADLYPAVLATCWGFNLKDRRILPNHLKPLELAVRDAVRRRGIVVCSAAGNGEYCFPAMMPEVLSVGGVYASEQLVDGDFSLEASDYASSFVSNIYPGRRVPDVCGVMGNRAHGQYLLLPVPPGSIFDTCLSRGEIPPVGLSPDGTPALVAIPGAAQRITPDGTEPADGWIASSGTSATTAQIAGICALLRQAQPGLPPRVIRAVLRSSARDVTRGRSATDDQAGLGQDNATGAGLVDVAKAYELARSITPRSLVNIPAPI